MCKKTLEVFNKAMDIYKEMKIKKNELDLLKEKLNLVEFKLRKEMDKKDEIEIKDEVGSVKLVIQDRKGNFDNDKLCKALKVETAGLDKFRKKSIHIESFKYNLVK